MDNKTLEAAREYFLIHLCQTLSAVNITAPTKVEMEDYLPVAIRLTSEEMDGVVLNWELTDHAVHWVVDLSIEGEEEKVEIPIHAIAPSQLHVHQPLAFLSEVVRMCVLTLENPHISPTTIRHVSKKIEELIGQCKGCEACFTLEQVVFKEVPLFYFRTKIGGARSDALFMTYEVPWPRI